MRPSQEAAAAEVAEVDEERPQEGVDEERPSEAADEERPSEVADKVRPSEAADEERPSEAADAGGSVEDDDLCFHIPIVLSKALVCISFQ